MKLTNDFFVMAGFAARAGALISGFSVVEKTLQKGKLRLVILDAGISENTMGKMMQACGKRGIPCIVVDPIGEMGHRTGRPGAKVFGVTQNVFAARLKQIITESAKSTEV